MYLPGLDIAHMNVRQTGRLTEVYQIGTSANRSSSVELAFPSTGLVEWYVLYGKRGNAFEFKGVGRYALKELWRRHRHERVLPSGKVGRTRIDRARQRVCPWGGGDVVQRKTDVTDVDQEDELRLWETRGRPDWRSDDLTSRHRHLTISRGRHI